MFRRTLAIATLAGGLVLVSAAPGLAAGEILITQAKAIAGQVTPGDAPGYPITLNQPGSYRLASNLVAAADRNGIVIASPLVTIDFNGFRLAGAGAAVFGIVGTQYAATIRNGTVTGFRQSGIRATGLWWMIRDMRVINNLGSGIDCGTACLVERSIVSNNGAHGINMASGLVLANTIAENVGFGLRGTGEGVGYGNNAFIFNTGGVFDQVDGEAVATHPNVCREAADPLEAC
jgi:hypothetical protein